MAARNVHCSPEVPRSVSQIPLPTLASVASLKVLTVRVVATGGLAGKFTVRSPAAIEADLVVCVARVDRTTKNPIRMIPDKMNTRGVAREKRGTSCVNSKLLETRSQLLVGNSNNRDEKTLMLPIVHDRYGSADRSG